jgi:hypothetical protein
MIHFSESVHIWQRKMAPIFVIGMFLVLEKVVFWKMIVEKQLK